MANDRAITGLAEELAGNNAEETLQAVAARFGNGVVFASSLGLEDQVITDMISRHGLDIPIFTLDTGRLFPETYNLIAATEKRYGIKIQLYSPRHEALEDLVNNYGINLFYDSIELRRRCCQVRKLEPLSRALRPYQAWICGLRREQSEARAAVEIIENDGQGRVKINPLCHWTTADVWNYIRINNVPYNNLADQGFISIGCSCCTRAIKDGESMRDGRWWWEKSSGKECGLHVVNGRLVRGHNQDGVRN